MLKYPTLRGGVAAVFAISAFSPAMAASWGSHALLRKPRLRAILTWS